jgi:hypothetical protein
MEIRDSKMLPTGIFPIVFIALYIGIAIKQFPISLIKTLKCSVSKSLLISHRFVSFQILECNKLDHPLLDIFGMGIVVETYCEERKGKDSKTKYRVRSPQFSRI